MEKERRKIVKGKVENVKKEGERSMKMIRGPFLFFLFLFCFSLFGTTEICFGCTKMENFYREKAYLTSKKSGKWTLPPLKNIPLTPLRLYSKSV